MKLGSQLSPALTKTGHLTSSGSAPASADNEALVSTQAIFSAMPPERHPANGQTLDLEMVGCAFRDDEPAYWTLQQENLRRQFDAKVRGALSLRRSDTSASSRSRRSHVASALPPVT
jgi:hypothetical protein